MTTRKREEREIRFVVHGAPRTKKNHGIITTRGRRPRLLPSKEFSAWNRIAQMQLCRVPMLPPGVKLNVRAEFYLERDTGDAVGYYQALADALEEAGIIENDRLLVSWDGSRLLKDARNPRIEVEITPQERTA